MHLVDALAVTRYTALSHLGVLEPFAPLTSHTDHAFMQRQIRTCVQSQTAPVRVPPRLSECHVKGEIDL